MINPLIRRLSSSSTEFHALQLCLVSWRPLKCVRLNTRRYLERVILMEKYIYNTPGKFHPTEKLFKCCTIQILPFLWSSVMKLAICLELRKYLRCIPWLQTHRVKCLDPSCWGKLSRCSFCYEQSNGYLTVISTISTII